LANIVFPLGVGGGMVQALNEQKASDFWSARTTSPTFARTEVWGVSNTTTYALSDKITLKNILGYRHTQTDSYIDTDDSRFVVIETSLPAVVKQVSEEAQIQYNGERLRLIGGAFYFDEKGRSGGFNNVLGAAGFRTVLDEQAENISKSLFAEGNYSVTDKFNVTLGARYSWDDRRYSPSIHHDFSENLVASALGSVCFETDAQGLPLPGCRAFEKAQFAKPTFNLTGQYQFTPVEQVYASIRTGYRTGGFSVGSESAAQRVPYDPETVVNYELGYKGEFQLGETALRVNAATYYSDYKNIQKSVLACIGGPPCSFVARVQNAAAAKIKGVEVEVTWRLSAELELSGFYSYTDAKYDRYFSSAATGTPVDLSKQPFAYLPQTQSGVTARYTIPVEGHDLSLQANASYQSSENLSGDEAPGPGIFQPGYALANLRAELALNPQMTVSLWGRNVFNKKYYTSGINTFYSIGYAAMFPGEPQSDTVICGFRASSARRFARA
jgi:iron complex outermembrane receptor protein